MVTHEFCLKSKTWHKAPSFIEITKGEGFWDRWVVAFYFPSSRSKFADLSVRSEGMLWTWWSPSTTIIRGTWTSFTTSIITRACLINNLNFKFMQISLEGLEIKKSTIFTCIKSAHAIWNAFWISVTINNTSVKNMSTTIWTSFCNSYI